MVAFDIVVATAPVALAAAIDTSTNVRDSREREIDSLNR